MNKGFNTKQMRIKLSDLPEDKELGPIEPSDSMIDLARLGGTVIPILVTVEDKKYKVLYGSREIKAARMSTIQDISAVVVDVADRRDDEVILAYVNSLDIKSSLAYKLDVMYYVISRNGTLEEVMRVLGCGLQEANTLLAYTKLPFDVVQGVVAGVVRENLLRALIGAPLVVQEEIGGLVAQGVKVTPKEVKKLISDMQGQANIMDLVPGTNIIGVKNHGHKLTLEIYADGKPHTVVVTAKQLLEMEKSYA